MTTATGTCGSCSFLLFIFLSSKGISNLIMHFFFSFYLPVIQKWKVPAPSSIQVSVSVIETMTGNHGKALYWLTK